MDEFENLADGLIYLASPEDFWAVGQFYWDFDQLSDEEVTVCLAKNRPSSEVGRS